MIFPWQNRGGSLSPLKLVVFLALFLPGSWTLINLAHGSLGPRPLTEAIHQTGLWAVRFLLISLAISPLRRVLHWPRLILVRRKLINGLTALVILDGNQKAPTKANSGVIGPIASRECPEGRP